MTNVTTGRPVSRQILDRVRRSMEAHQPSVQQLPHLGGEVSAVGRIGGEDMLVGLVTRVLPAEPDAIDRQIAILEGKLRRVSRDTLATRRSPS
jgi:hypothetical protein